VSDRAGERRGIERRVADRRVADRRGTSAVLEPPVGLPETDETQHYRAVFEALSEALCVVEMTSSDVEQPAYRFVEGNAAFLTATGLATVVGAPSSNVDPKWAGVLAADRCARIAASGTPERFVTEFEADDERQRFDVYAFRLGGDGSRRVAVHFTDVTERPLSIAELRDRSAQFRDLIANAPIGVFLVDAAFHVTHVNPVAAAAFGAVPDVLDRDFEEVMRLVWREGLASEVIEAFRHTLDSGTPYRSADILATSDELGVDAYYDWRTHRILMPDGEYGVVCYFSDVSPDIEARRALAASHERYRDVFERLDQGLCVVHVLFDDTHTAIDYRFVEVNDAFVARTGHAEPVGRTIRELEPEDAAGWVEVCGDVAATGVAQRFMEYAERLDRWLDVSAVRIGDASQRTVAMLFQDVTDRKRAEKALEDSVLQLRHRTHHDPLTGLPNRILFEERLGLALAGASRYGRKVGVLFIDLDGFKAINDAHGHSCGDVVLKEIAQRLEAALRTTDTLARMHGDEFVVLLPEVRGRDEIATVATTLLTEVTRPVAVDDAHASVTASIGVSLFPNHGRHAHGLMHAADAAMYLAKASGKNTVRFFSAATKAAALVRRGTATATPSNPVDPDGVTPE
jgi:diguanylate cyclase (GGDEF)-like protein/PAS domain S-box-containing protein